MFSKVCMPIGYFIVPILLLVVTRMQNNDYFLYLQGFFRWICNHETVPVDSEIHRKELIPLECYHITERFLSLER